MLFDACDENTIVVGYNTDSVTVVNPCKTYPEKMKCKEREKFPTDQIGKIFTVPKGRAPDIDFRTYPIKDMNLENFKAKHGNGKEL